MKLTFAIAATLLCAAATAAHADTLASSNFATDPTGGADPRFTYSAANQTLTAHYNTSLPTDKLLFPLAHPLTAENSFTINTSFTINSANFSADPNGFAQIAFGLVNSVTTGNDRSGGVGASPSNPFGSSGDTFDIVTVDYFPNVSPIYGGPTLTPTVITSQTGSEPAFDDLNSVFGQESELDDPGESPLPLDTPLTATLSYDASSRLFTLSMATSAGPLFIDYSGDEDGDTSTIQMALPTGVDFNVDSYAIPLWTDSYATDGPSVVADVAYSSFSVTTPVPEPASLGILIVTSLMLARRRQR